MIWRVPGSTSLVIAPSQRQSAELVRRLRTFLVLAGEKLKVDNTYSVEIAGSGSRCIALPGSDDSTIRGLSITGDCTIDEAARVSEEIFHTVRPMLIRYSKQNRFMVISTAWLKDGEFYRIWSDPALSQDWRRIQARVEDCSYLDQATLDAERRALGDKAFKREYLSIFGDAEELFFNLASIEAAAGTVSVPVPPPTAPDDDPIVETTPLFRSVA
jgi:hypothetical protein